MMQTVTVTNTLRKNEMLDKECVCGSKEHKPVRERGVAGMCIRKSCPEENARRHREFLKNSICALCNNEGIYHRRWEINGRVYDQGAIECPCVERLRLAGVTRCQRGA